MVFFIMLKIAASLTQSYIVLSILFYFYFPYYWSIANEKLT